MAGEEIVRGLWEFAMRTLLCQQIRNLWNFVEAMKIFIRNVDILNRSDLGDRELVSARVYLSLFSPLKKFF